MKTIHTEYQGPTANTGSRIRVSGGSKRAVSVPYDYEFDAGENHDRAARAYAVKHGATGVTRTGETRNCRGFVYAVQS